MLTTLASTQHNWQYFYTLLGGSAATLIGLTFIMVSLGVQIITEDTKWRVHVFITPLITHFSAVLFACLLVLAPMQRRSSLAGEVLAVGVAGLAYLASLIPGFRRLSEENVDTRAWKIFTFYGPVLCYAAIVTSGAQMLAHVGRGFWILAMALTFLVCLTIRNTWYSTISIASKQLSQRSAIVRHRKALRPAKRGPSA